MCTQLQKGFAFSLSLLHWDVFNTLTFKDPLPSERCRWRLAWRHLHELSQSLCVPYASLLIALRSEHGELGDRPHFHYLLGETGASNNYSLAAFAAYRWKCLCKGGHSEARPYDPALAGPDYIEACLGGGNAYELAKFNRSDRLECSASVHRRINCDLRRGRTNGAGQASLKNTGAAEAPAVVVYPSGERLRIIPCSPRLKTSLA